MLAVWAGWLCTDHLRVTDQLHFKSASLTGAAAAAAAAAAARRLLRSRGNWIC